MKTVDIVTCGPCKGNGKCQCDECQQIDFGRTYSSDGHYSKCSACGGAGSVAIDTPYGTCGHCDGTGRCQCD